MPGVSVERKVHSCATRCLSVNVYPFEPERTASEQQCEPPRGSPPGAYLCGRAGGRRWAPPCWRLSRGREPLLAAPPPRAVQLQPAEDRRRRDRPRGASARARGGLTAGAPAAERLRHRGGEETRGRPSPLRPREAGSSRECTLSLSPGAQVGWKKPVR